MEFLSKENVQLKDAIEMTKKRENQLSVENRFLKEIQIRGFERGE
jgi:small nuclear ribonucleoprotein (snRNP)-like protein